LTSASGYRRLGASGLLRLAAVMEIFENGQTPGCFVPGLFIGPSE